MSGNKLVPVSSRVHRILRPLTHFQYFGPEGPPVPEELPLMKEESLIGAYLNDPPSLRNAVIVTNFSLLLESHGAWAPIHYSSVSRVVSPTSKEGVRYLDLVLADGSTARVPIHGGTERTSDAFEFLRFLDRVLEDRRLASQSEEHRMAKLDKGSEA